MLRIDRPTSPLIHLDQLTRHKHSIVLDLKNPASIAVIDDILKNADVLIDPYRPGTIEALGLNPVDLRQSNPRLIVARLTGFRRDGKYKDMAGHDINYLAVSGILSQLGRKGAPPYAPANLLADFAGGGLMCVVGILLALVQRGKSGEGQVVEANMVDGSAYLGTFMTMAMKTPMWDQPRGENILDGGCPWYDVYECKDGAFMAVGALENKFFKELMVGLDLDERWMSDRLDRRHWSELRRLLEDKFGQRSRSQWEEVFDGKDACCTPVLGQRELEEACYDERPAVGLTGSPGHSILEDRAQDDGGEEVLLRWRGWRKGRDYVVEEGSIMRKETSKL